MALEAADLAQQPELTAIMESLDGAFPCNTNIGIPIASSNNVELRLRTHITSPLTLGMEASLVPPLLDDSPVVILNDTSSSRDITSTESAMTESTLMDVPTGDHLSILHPMTNEGIQAPSDSQFGIYSPIQAEIEILMKQPLPIPISETSGSLC